MSADGLRCVLCGWEKRDHRSEAELVWAYRRHECEPKDEA